MKIVDEKTGNDLKAKIIFSFVCPKDKKKYVVFDFKKSIYNQTSTYSNLNILEITKEESNAIYVSEIQDSDWENVKYTLQNEILANLK